MIRTPLRVAAVALACTLSLSLAACGGSDDQADDDTTTTVADGGTDSGDTGSGDTGTDATEPADDGGDEGSCVADSNELSGSSTVVWQDGDPVAENTMTFQADGSLDPADLSVDVDEQFFVDHGEGTDLRVVKIGCAGGQTLPGGVTAGFVINAPGTYTIIDEAADGYAGAEVGTVTVG